MWPPHILDLPIETKLIIFSYLPFKEIQRARVICRHIRDMIDHDTNRIFLLKSTAPIEVLAIKEAYSNLFEFDPRKNDILKSTNFVFNLRRRAHHTGTQLKRQKCFHNTCELIASL
ncbi:hypothetical protein AC578_7603 [Pseudocercospora eumusae]|uniref:F-box domain-containing protein n=1 Tax=Pseudocercospora eumusae TaxID=321146 RepID=A0A139HRQ3_9PEZI|nr:hypothetical protein AC578_7603 [Pseudocercospora eumusae]